MSAQQFAANSIARHEDYRQFVYDDATGAKVVPGYTMVGHPTIGFGLALDITGVSIPQATVLLQNKIVFLDLTLRKFFPWFAPLSDVRQAVILDIAYATGVGGVGGFHRMVAAIVAGHFDKAADEIIDSALVQSRREELELAMRTGQAPPWMLTLTLAR